MELKPSGDRPRVPRDRLILWFALFFSGAAGMAYEIIWFRSLRVSYGHTLHAMTVVVAVYMAGLALGSWLFRRYLNRYPDALFAYGFVELAIAAAAFAAMWILGTADRAFLASYAWIHEYPLFRTVAQTALTAPALFVPTILMGTTLPLAVRAVEGKAGGKDDAVGLFNGANLAGAAVGVFATGYVVLPALGTPGTQALAACMNLLAALTALVIWWRRKRSPVAASHPPSETATMPPVEEASSLSRAHRAALAGAAISGACAMGYELVWGRALIPLVGSSVYAFTTITVTLLAGLAVGSHLFIRIGKLSTPRALGALQVASAAAAFMLLPAFNLFPPIVARWISGLDGSFSGAAIVQFALVALILILPTTIQGMALPCAVACFRENRGDAAPDLARVYVYNTIGAVAGTLLTGFVLMPLLGSKVTLGLWVLASIVAGWALIRPRGSALRAFLMLLAAGAAIGTFALRWNSNFLSINIFTLPGAYAEILETGNDNALPEILFLREGRESTISVFQKNGIRVLTVNGKPDAGTGPDMPTQKKLAHFPMFFHPAPKDVAVLGLGSGITVGHAAAYGEVERIDVIELEPAVAEAARFFSPENMDVLDDPRMRLHLDDGLIFFKGTDRTFDVIISEPSNPWVAGVADLFTAEAFHAVRSRLKEGGVFCQWLHGYSMGVEEFRTITRTFLSEFPNATLWSSYGNKDYLLLGWKGNVPPVTREALLGHFEKSPKLYNLLGSGVDSTVYGILGDFLLDSGELLRFAGSGPLNTDKYPILEFIAAKNLYTNSADDIFAGIVEYRQSSYPKFLEGLNLQTDSLHITLAERFLSKGNTELARFELSRYREEHPDESVFPAMDTTKWEGGCSPRRMTFEAGENFPLYPALGSLPPQMLLNDSPASNLWQTNLTYFSLTSGIRTEDPHSGRCNLTLGGTPSIRLSGYSIPMNVIPNRTYELRFWMKSDLDEDSVYGAVVLDRGSNIYNTEILNHLLENELSAKGVPLFISSGLSPWREHRILFRSGPETTSVCIEFFRDGPNDKRIVAVDDLSADCVN